IISLNTYAEVSPSGTGVKLWVIGKPALTSGRKVAVKDVDRIGEKEAAIEIYFERRYFAVTGCRLQGPPEPEARQAQLAALIATCFPQEKRQAGADWYTDSAVIERARKYIATLPPAVSGQGGHNAAFRAACVLILGFCLSEHDALLLMHEFSQRCNPPWS